MEKKEFFNFFIKYPARDRPLTTSTLQGENYEKNLLSGLLAGVMAVSLVACGNSESTPAADSTTETAKPATAENSDTFDVEMVGNSFSIEYCNINVDGARDAVDDLAKKGLP